MFATFALYKPSSGIISHMDKVDRKILSLLEDDGRMTITTLADEARLSISACHRRLKDLERTGVITGYSATINPEAIGRGFQAIVFVTMRDGNGRAIRQFEEALDTIPEVLEADRLLGDPDFLLRVSTTDLNAFQKLYDDHLTALPGVLKLSTTLVMKPVVRHPLMQSGR